MKECVNLLNSKHNKIKLSLNMDNYQKNYENKVGSVKLNIKRVIVGQRVCCRLSYKAGFYGIDDTGSLKILFRQASDFEEFQFDNTNKSNFVQISTNNKNIKFKIESPVTCGVKKNYIRPWTRGFTAHISGDYLKEGDYIFVDFVNWRIQTFYEKTFEFRVCVDPFAVGKYTKIKKSPEIELIPDKPARLKIIAPTKVEVDNIFKVLLKIEDQYGNPCRYQNGVFIFKNNKQICGLPVKINFKNGRAIVKISILKDGTNFISASFAGIHGNSNPIVSSNEDKNNYYWADFHAQSEETIGTNDISDYFKFAKDYAFLDIASHQANDFQITDDIWKKINNTTSRVNKEGEFIVFPGYEWSGNTNLGGDRNVIYLEEGKKIFRSSRALVDDFQNMNDDAPTVQDLFKKLKSNNTIVFSHVGGRYANLNMHNKEIEKCVEIHSSWGTFEWFFHEALCRGYRIGVVANSDGHEGRPGASYPGIAHFGSLGGLTCVISNKLSRKNIFTALQQRHCYATTGARIYLNVDCISSKENILMGDIVRVAGNPTLKISCCGTTAIDRVEVWNKNKIIYTHFPSIKNHLFKVACIGSKCKGRSRRMSWSGEIKTNDNAILGKIHKINFFNSDNSVIKSSNGLKWEGETTGGVQALLFALKDDQGNLEMVVNNKAINILVKEITQIPTTLKMKGMSSRVEIYRVSRDNKPNTQTFTCEIKGMKKGDNPVFVKVIQKDGHIAWSSPIYFVK